VNGVTPESIAVYMRVSTSDQSTDAQRSAIESYLANHGIDVPAHNYYIDEGVSGAVINRPALIALNAEVFKGTIRTVVLYDLSRLSRSAYEGINVLRGWLDNEARVILVSIQLDLGQHVGRMIASLLLHLAEMERAMMRERQAHGHDVARQTTRQVKAMYAKGIPKDEIAASVKLTRPQVESAIQVKAGSVWWNGARAPSKASTKRAADLKTITRLVRRGWTNGQIASALDMPKGCVVNHIVRLGGRKQIQKEMLQTENE